MERIKLSRSDDKLLASYQGDAVGSHFGHTLGHSMRMPSKARGCSVASTRPSSKPEKSHEHADEIHERNIMSA